MMAASANQVRRAALAPHQIEAAKAGAVLSIFEIAERGGVQIDPRKSRPATGDYWALCCFHAEKSASLHIMDRGPKSFFKCHGCGEKGDAIELARRLFNLGFRDAVRMIGGDLDAEPDPELIEAREQRRREMEAEAERQRATNRAAAQAVYYAAGVHVAGTLGEIYLRARSIRAPLGGAELRFHARAPLSPYDHAKAGRNPAIVAAIRNAAGEHIGSHCTFLSSEGNAKADLPHLKGSRLVCGEHVGGFIRLGRFTDAVVVGEGIETTLSASEACGLPGLAAINSANLRAVVLPSSVRRVLIAFDRDAKGIGEMSAEALAERLHRDGVRVDLVGPPGGFKDWNDCAQAGGLPRVEVAA